MAGFFSRISYVGVKTTRKGCIPPLSLPPRCHLACPSLIELRGLGEQHELPPGPGRPGLTNEVKRTHHKHQRWNVPCVNYMTQLAGASSLWSGSADKNEWLNTPGSVVKCCTGKAHVARITKTHRRFLFNRPISTSYCRLGYTRLGSSRVWFLFNWPFPWKCSSLGYSSYKHSRSEALLVAQPTTSCPEQEAQLLLGWPTVLPYSRRLCKSCGAFVQIGPAVFS